MAEVDVSRDEQFGQSQEEYDMEAAAEKILADKSHRGKGQNYCPWGNACDKGGVENDGSLVMFERNHAYRYAATVQISKRMVSSPGISGPTSRNT